MTVREAEKIVKEWKRNVAEPNVSLESYIQAETVLQCHELYKPLVEALQKIADKDYRGNRSQESVDAFKALQYFRTHILGEEEK